MNIFPHYRFSRLICLCLVCLLTVPALSQQEPSCAEKLQTAQTLFERGQVEQVPGLISRCLESGFNREESLQAFKLLIQTYLFNENSEKADSTMLAFLKKNPEYKVSPTDHSSFVSLFNNFSSKVVIQFSLHLGTNLPFVFVNEHNPLFGIDAEEKYSSKAANFYGSIEARYRLKDRLELNAELGYSQLSFSLTGDIKSDADNIYAKYSFEEIRKQIEIPVSATYDVFRWGKLTPYARLGAGLVISIDSYGIGEFNPTDRNNPYDHQGNNVTDLPRVPLNTFIQAGGGIKFKIRDGFLFGEIRSNFGLGQQTTPFKFEGENLDKYYFYMPGENKFRLNAMNFSVGYTRIFYKPVKREE
ncbi:MAG TPA: outer membrane beta-barrel protein [Bacteroidales bacterium]|nr:outer membrane beta-barrel protein [Bacteroidales bacterium]